MKIVTDEKELRVKSIVAIEDVVKITGVWDKLKETVYENPTCVGLAAIQIGIPIMCAYFRFPDGDLKIQNPVITYGSGKLALEGAKLPPETVYFKEGCMSFPGVFVKTERFNVIYIKDDFNVEPVRYEGFKAICLQHEYDHFFGTLMFDRKVDTTVVNKPKIGRNDPCPCGKFNPVTGKVAKYKKCCGK